MLAQGQAREQAAESREPPHLIVVAKAGTGKTTTLVAGMQVMKGLPPTNAKGDPITPSPQQAAVWDAMMLSRGERRVGFCAFNNSIAGELKRRVPPGCDAMTVHGMGFGAVNRAFRSLGDPNKDRVTNIISELLGIEIRLLRREKPILLAATDELVRLCKMTLAGWDNNGMVTDDELLALTDRYDIDLGEHAAEVFQLVPAVLERCMDVQKDGYIDFNDMVWLPLVLDLPIKVYDVLLGDEVQDWNRCQQELVKKAGRRLILCGDPNQAIYGFSGADSESMKRLETDLRGGKLTCPRCHNADKYRPGCDACGATGLVGPGRGVQVLPLTVTRRCGKKIVERAQKFVSGFSAHESNPDGKVLFAKYTEESANPSGNYWTGGDEAERRTKPVPIEKTYIPLVRDGDMVVCRTNAPLVSQCFKFLKAGRKATIQGRKDIGKGIKDLIDKLKPESVVKLVEKVSDWGHEEASKELAKRNPDDARLISIYDRVECLICFTEGAKTVDDVMRKIDSIFTDEMQPQGIRLSSIHKAKGLESTRVFFLQPRGSECPHPRAADRGGWQYEQERNLAYVAITRAIEELYYVS